MQIGYGIILGEDVNKFMRGIELLLFDKFNLEAGLHQPPHVTIKPPFEVDDVVPYQNYLDELCEKIKPFDVHLKGFNCFSNKVIYLDVQHNPRLYDIYETIFKDIKDKYDPELERDNMIFHGTLAYDDIEEETFNKAYEYLKENYQPDFKVTVKKIGLFCQLYDGGEWIIIKQKSLNI